jgi:hypothetical protein
MRSCASGLREEALFDIAEVESTLPQGKRNFFMHGGDTIDTLTQAYTTDGGHLNESGRQQVAAAFCPERLVDPIRTNGSTQNGRIASEVRQPT